MKQREHAIRSFGLVLALIVTGLPVASVSASWSAASSVMLAQEALPAQTPMFRSAVRRVRVDAIVADQDGNFLDDLKADDFRVFEDGVEQEILNVQYVSLTRAEVTNVASHDETVTAREEVPAEPAPIRRSPASLGAVVYPGRLAESGSKEQTAASRLSRESLRRGG